MTCIHEFETEDIAEEGAVGFGVFAVNNHMSPRNHLPLPGNARSFVSHSSTVAASGLAPCRKQPAIELKPALLHRRKIGRTHVGYVHFLHQLLSLLGFNDLLKLRVCAHCGPILRSLLPAGMSYDPDE